LIKGERVELRPVTEADLVRQFEWRNDEEVARWAAGSEAAEYSNLPLESLRAMYTEAVRNTRPSDNLRGCVFSVYTLDGVHIGTCDAITIPSSWGFCARTFFAKRKRPA
jgi:RimJ/RimL family protein N-acetyltransferase